MLAAIPYTTFPDISIGPLTIRAFGLMVGIGVLVGAWIAARYIEQRTDIPREETYRMATRLVVAGVIGARLTFVLSHLEQMDSPIDVIAVWEGGLQFSGGFLGAIVFGIPFFRRWDRRTRWIALDGYAYGLSLGLAIGRIGCYSVGEHFGSATTFFLGTRYDGGSTREGLGSAFPTAGDFQANGVGTVFHHTALYEFGYLLVLFVILGVLVRRNAAPATLMGVFCAFYGISRFLSDFLRVNDETVGGLTGAQYLMAAIALASIWIFLKVRPSLATDPEPEPADEAEQADEEDEEEEVAEESAEP